MVFKKNGGLNSIVSSLKKIQEAKSMIEGCVVLRRRMVPQELQFHGDNHINSYKKKQ